MGSRTLDLKGQVFGRLTVIEEGIKDKHRKVTWKCECSCGGKKTVLSSNLRRGDTTSCGCYQKEASSASCKSRAHEKVTVLKIVDESNELDRKLVEKRKLRKLNNIK